MLDVLESSEKWRDQAIFKPNYDRQGLPIIALPYLVIMKLQSSRGIDIGDLTRMLGIANDQQLNLVRDAVKFYMDDAVEDLESLITIGKLECDSLIIDN